MCVQADEECTDSLAALCKLVRTIDTSSVATTHAVALALRDAFGHMPTPEPIEALGHVLLSAYSNHATRNGSTPVSAAAAGSGATLASTATAAPTAAGCFGALVPPSSTGGAGGPGSVGGGSSGASSPTKSSAASAADAAAAARSGAASALKAASALNRTSSDLGLNSFKGTGTSGSAPLATSGTVVADVACFLDSV